MTENSHLSIVDLYGWFRQTLLRAAWAPLLVVLIHAFASLVLGAYPKIPWLDIPMHLLGGLTMAYFLGEAFRIGRKKKILGQPSDLVFFLWVAGGTCSAAVFWEFFEFLSDRFLGTRAN